MELRPGYKQTEVGVIPEDWEVKSLGEVTLRVRLGGNYPNQDTVTEFPLMKMGNLGRGNFDLSKVQYVSKTVQPDVIHKLVSGDVLFNTRNTLDLVGKVALWRNELPSAYYNSNLMRLEFDPNQISSQVYANDVLNTDRSISRLRTLATGTTSVAAIYTRDLLSFLLPIPPLAEQKAIAQALSDMDALISGLDDLIAKKRDIKQSTMQQLLTGKTRLPGFTGEWEVKRLGDVADIRSGGTPSTGDTRYWNGNIPWCTPTDITGLRGRKSLSNTVRTITPLGLQSSSAEMVPAMSVIMTSRATIGECAINAVPVATNQGFKNLIPYTWTDVTFLYYLLRSHKGGFVALCSGSTFLEIGKVAIASYEIPFPNLSEQQAIATVLSDIDDELAALEQRREKTRELKQAMMQELLTGRTRLV